MASVAIFILVARWSRLSRGEWQTRRELAFVGALVGTFSVMGARIPHRVLGALAIALGLAAVAIAVVRALSGS